MSTTEHEPPEKETKALIKRQMKLKTPFDVLIKQTQHSSILEASTVCSHDTVQFGCFLKQKKKKKPPTLPSARDSQSKA